MINTRTRAIIRAEGLPPQSEGTPDDLYLDCCALALSRQGKQVEAFEVLTQERASYSDPALAAFLLKGTLPPKST